MLSEPERRRLLYRAQHRGTAEMDFLIGRYAAARLATLETRELASFSALLDLADPLLGEYILSSPDAAPAALRPLLDDIRRFHGLVKAGPDSPDPESG